jgi:hypothetical protein
MLEDLVEIASLTGPQLDMVYHTGPPTAGATKHREVLRFYEALNSLQRARLQTTGLRVLDVSPPQVAILRAWKTAVVFQIATAGTPRRKNACRWNGAMTRRGRGRQRRHRGRLESAPDGRQSKRG